jgi:hypothetical protein
LDIHGLNKPTRISTGRNAHSLGEQNRTEENPHPNQQSKNEIDPEAWENHTVNLIEELDDEQIRNALLH